MLILFSLCKKTRSQSKQTWLWSGNGMIEAQTPNINEGWISQCVYVSE